MDCEKTGISPWLMRWALVMMWEPAAWRKITLSRVRGALPEAITSRSTSPAPTDGSWSTSPTSSRCVPGLSAFNKAVRQRQVEHGGFVHHQQIDGQRVLGIVFEPFGRRGPQQAVDGAGRPPGGLRQALGGAAGGRSQGIRPVGGLHRGDEGLDGGGLARARAAGQHADRAGEGDADGRLLLCRQRRLGAFEIQPGNIVRPRGGLRQLAQAFGHTGFAESTTG